MSSVFKTHSLNIKAQFRVLISALLLSLLVGCSSAPQSSTGQAVYYALQTLSLIHI